MTLVQALWALYEAGRLRRPYLPGMLIGAFKGGLPLGACRIVRVLRDSRGIYLEVIPGGGASEIEGWTRLALWASGVVSGVDEEDPATRGCLLELLREASGDPRARPMPYLLGSQGWHIVGRGALDSLLIDAPTEGAAFVAALIALAGLL